MFMSHQIIMSEIEGCASTFGDGTGNSQALCFDGFSLIQAHCICTDSSMRYIETSSHMQLIRAFVTSWLSPFIAIASYKDEFLITGNIYKNKYMNAYFILNIINAKRCHWISDRRLRQVSIWRCRFPHSVFEAI